MDLTRLVEFTKRDNEKRLVYGVVLEPDVVDAQGDTINAEEIEKACHDFMKRHQRGQAVIGYMHKRAAPDVEIIECSIAPQDYRLGSRQVKKGSWVLGCHVGGDSFWKEVKEGKITGFSIGGSGHAEN